VRITLERFLHLQGQRVHAAAHVGVAGGNPHPHPEATGSSPPTSASTATAAVSAAVSTAPLIRIRAPVANSISIVPRSMPLAAASGAIRTGAKPIRARTPNCRRQPYSWPG